MVISATIARNTVGIIGNIISFGLLLSPMPTFWRIYKKKGVEKFKPDHYIAAVLNCILWIFYGMPFVHPDSVLVITINTVGLAIELIYLAVFFFYADTKGRTKISLYLLVEVIFIVVVALITMLDFHGTHTRSFLVGIICDFFTILTYFSLIATMVKVLETRSVKYMSFSISLANFLNACIWTAYALIKFDIFILISSGFGVILGFVQLILYAYYYFMGPKEEEDNMEKKTNEIQFVLLKLGANIV